MKTKQIFITFHIDHFGEEYLCAPLAFPTKEKAIEYIKTIQFLLDKDNDPNKKCIILDDNNNCVHKNIKIINATYKVTELTLLPNH